jgi:hypothetical protein
VCNGTSDVPLSSPDHFTGDYLLTEVHPHYWSVWGNSWLHLMQVWWMWLSMIYWSSSWHFPFSYFYNFNTWNWLLSLLSNASSLMNLFFFFFNDICLGFSIDIFKYKTLYLFSLLVNLLKNDKIIYQSLLSDPQK